MKKQFLLFVFFLCCSHGFSQTLEQVAQQWGMVLKSNDYFMKDQGPLFYYYGDNTIYLTDTEFNNLGWLIWDAKLSPEVMRYISSMQGGLGTGNVMNNYASHIGLTQTLFNDDDNYEYITIREGNLLIRQPGLYNSDGSNITEEKTLVTILPPEGYSFRGYDTCLYSLNNNNYIGLHCESTTDNTIQMIYFRIDKGNPSSIREGIIPESLSSPRRVYDINGKQISQPVKGINIIKDGEGVVRKVIFK